MVDKSGELVEERFDTDVDMVDEMGLRELILYFDTTGTLM